MKLSSSFKRLFTSHKAIFSAFAERHDLVYFGRINVRDDEQRIVHGMTVSNVHVDEHYSVGTAYGYDVTLLERTDTLDHPSSNNKEMYRWIIMQFDLTSPYHLQHVFLDGKHHKETFYQNLSIKFSQLSKIPPSVIDPELGKMSQHFNVYTPPDNMDELPTFFTKERREMLGHHFGQFDAEWFGQTLIVYSTSQFPTKHLLDHMLSMSHWLATELDAYSNQKMPATVVTSMPDSNET